MASVYQTFDKNGKPHPRWKYRYTDWNGKRKGGTGTRKKGETQKLADRLEMRAKEIREGIRPKPKTSDTPSSLADVAREYLEWGAVQGGRGGRPWSKVHSRNKSLYLDYWLRAFGPIAVQDVTLSRAEAILRELAKSGLPQKGRSTRVFCSNVCRAAASKRRARGEEVLPGEGCAICGKPTLLRKRRAKKLTGKTLQNVAEVLRSLLSWARRRGYVETNPLEYMKGHDTTPRSRRRAPTDREIQLILKHAASDAERLVYQVALCTGYRQGELRALRVHDLDAKGCTLPLAAEFTKARRAARQPIPRVLADRLATSCEGKAYDAPLLDGLDTKRGPLDALYATMKRAGIPKWAPGGKLDFHALRNGYISRVVEAGASAKEAQELARHSTPTITMNTYARASGDRLRAVAEKVGQVVLRAAESHTEAKRIAAGAESLTLSSGSVVPGVGIEPTWSCPQRFLKPSRLPFRHPGPTLCPTSLRGFNPQSSRCNRPPDHPSSSPGHWTLAPGNSEVSETRQQAPGSIRSRKAQV